MTGKELLLKKLQNYIEAGEITKEEILHLFDKNNEKQNTEEGSVIHLNGAVEKRERFVFLPFYVLLFIVSSAVLFLSQSWQNITAAERVLSTLGSGILGYVFGMLLIRLNSLTGILLHLIGGILLPFGALIFIDEFNSPLSINANFILLFAFLLILYAISYRFLKHRIIFFLMLTSGAGLLYSGIHFLLNAYFENASFLYPTLILGAAALLWGEIIKRTRNSTLSPILSILGTVFILGSVFTLLSFSLIVDILYVGLIFSLVILSLILQRRSILAVSILFLFGYLFYIVRHYLIGDTGLAVSSLLAFLVLAVTFALGFFIDRRFINSSQKHSLA